MGTVDIYPLIGDAIKKRRKRLSLTQDRLASALQISRASLANIEAGRQKILVHHLYALADALQVDIHDLLAEIPTSSNQSKSELPLPADLDERLKQQVMRVFSDTPTQPADTAETDETPNR